MKTLTIEVPDEVVEKLASRGLNPAEILIAASTGNEARSEMWAILQRLISGLRPQEIMEMRPSDQLNARVDELVRKEQAGLLTSEDTEDLRLFDMVEHMVRMAKIEASEKLRAA